MEKVVAFLHTHAKPGSSLTSDTRRLSAGDVFLAWPGAQVDGRTLIGQAVEQGAIAVLWEKRGGNWDQSCQVANMAVTNLADQAGLIAAQYYEQPSRKLSTVAITGTTGKTTVALWCAQLLRDAGVNTGYVGTLGASVSNQQFDKLDLTTPDAAELQKLLAKFVAAGVEATVLEASSHGLVQGRFNGFDCDVAVFTNLGHDHLDYHDNQDSYLTAKCLLFQRPELSSVIVNADDDHAQRIIDASVAEVTLCGTNEKCKVCWEYHGQGARGARGSLHFQNKNVEFELPMPGKFNVANVALAATGALQLGVAWDKLIEGIKRLSALPGRLELIGEGNPAAYVDFAHTPEALKNTLAALREAYPHRKLICVFGCGGNRDSTKRSQMGRVSTRYADTVIITSDNPRDEDPVKIAAEIAAQAPGASTILDRRAAIIAAVAQAKSDEVVLVAGKGHETTVIGPNLRKEHFSDAEVMREALAQ